MVAAESCTLDQTLAPYSPLSRPVLCFPMGFKAAPSVGLIESKKTNVDNVNDRTHTETILLLNIRSSVVSMDLGLLKGAVCGFCSLAVILYGRLLL